MRAPLRGGTVSVSGASSLPVAPHFHAGAGDLPRGSVDAIERID
jgi:hypothetical protein